MIDCRNIRRSEAGLSLFEVAVALFLAGIIIVPIAGVIAQFIFVPAQWSATVGTMTSARLAARAIAEDARQAAQFVSSTDPEYGTFTWTDSINFPTSSYAVRYFYSTGDTSLLREESVNGETSTSVVANDVAQYGDLSVSESGGLVVVSLRSTRDAIQENVAWNTTIRAHRRTNLATSQPAPAPFRRAWDDFETGDLTGGSGWLEEWSDSGDVSVLSAGTPYEGSFHLRLRRGTGYVERTLDLSGNKNIRLQFQAKVDSFEPGETAELLVSSDGVVYTPVKVWDDSDDDNTYYPEDIDLSSYTMASEFYIAFDANMSGAGDRFYVDDLKVISTWDP